MADSVTETTSEGYFSRLGGSIKGVVGGAVMVLISFPLLFWNEGRAVQTAKSLDEGQGAVRSVPADKVDGGNEAKLVHVTGESKTDEVVADPTFGVKATAIRLHRNVEMYQWKENKKSESREKIGGGKETTTTYTYEKTWSRNVIGSSDFKKAAEHHNPSSMPYESKSFDARKVTLGAYELPDAVISRLTKDESLDVKEMGDIEPPAGRRMRVVNGGFYIGNDPSDPEIGDTRVTFRVVNPGALSVIAAQQGNSFASYQTKAGDALLLVDEAKKTAAEMFASAQAANVMMTWIVRGIGFFLMFMGFSSVFRPLVMLVNVLPFLGDIVGFGVGLAAFVLAGAFSLLTISIAWMFYRPLLGIPLLAASIGLIVWVKTAGAKKKALAALAAPAATPAPS